MGALLAARLSAPRSNLNFHRPMRLAKSCGRGPCVVVATGARLLLIEVRGAASVVRLFALYRPSIWLGKASDDEWHSRAR